MKDQVTYLFRIQHHKWLPRSVRAAWALTTRLSPTGLEANLGRTKAGENEAMTNYNALEQLIWCPPLEVCSWMQDSLDAPYDLHARSASTAVEYPMTAINSLHCQWGSPYLACLDTRAQHAVSNLYPWDTNVPLAITTQFAYSASMHPIRPQRNCALFGFTYDCWACSFLPSREGYELELHVCCGSLSRDGTGSARSIHSQTSS